MDIYGYIFEYIGMNIYTYLCIYVNTFVYVTYLDYYYFDLIMCVYFERQMGKLIQNI